MQKWQIHGVVETHALPGPEWELVFLWQPPWQPPLEVDAIKQRACMNEISASELKTILHSKRANLYYLEHCRVLVNGGRVEYVTDEGRQSLYWNIPIANTTTLLLGRSG
jgi:hypothetical protein